MSGAVLAKGALVYGAYWLGSVLDARFGTSPFVVLAFVLVAIVIGLWGILYLATHSKL